MLGQWVQLTHPVTVAGRCTARLKVPPGPGRQVTAVPAQGHAGRTSGRHRTAATLSKLPKNWLVIPNCSPRLSLAVFGVSQGTSGPRTLDRPVSPPTTFQRAGFLGLGGPGVRENGPDRLTRSVRSRIATHGRADRAPVILWTRQPARLSAGPRVVHHPLKRIPLVSRPAYANWDGDT